MYVNAYCTASICCNAVACHYCYCLLLFGLECYFSSLRVVLRVVNRSQFTYHKGFLRSQRIYSFNCIVIIDRLIGILSNVHESRIQVGSMLNVSHYYKAFAWPFACLYIRFSLLMCRLSHKPIKSCPSPSCYPVHSCVTMRLLCLKPIFHFQTDMFYVACHFTEWSYSYSFVITYK